MMENLVFGARMRTFIKTESDITTLSKRLCDKLGIHNFEISYSEYSPHKLIGSGEVMGLGIGLSQIDQDDIRGVCNGYNYEIEVLTEQSTDEILNDRIHDLSLWFARYLATVCFVDTAVLCEDGSCISFTGNS